VVLEVWEREGLTLAPMSPEGGRAAIEHGLQATQGQDRWVDAGSLLGIVRDGNLIQHDTDIDIAIAMSVGQAFECQLPSADVVRTVGWHGLPMQHAYRFADTIVDFYFYYSGIKVGHLVNVNTDCVIEIPVELVFPLERRRRWAGLTVPIPARPADYLCWTFGADWRVPRLVKGPWADERANVLPNTAVDEWSLDPVLARMTCQLGEVRGERDAAVAELGEVRGERDAAVAELGEVRGRSIL